MGYKNHRANRDGNDAVAIYAKYVQASRQQ
jgi:hypothetical protein